MSKLFIQVLLPISLFFLLLSCSKSDDNNTPQNNLVTSSESSEFIQITEPSTEVIYNGSGSTQRRYTSILDIMQLVITPATDLLWGVDNPQTDEEWAVLEQAAITVIEAANETSNGGSGPQDIEWISAPAYQAMNQIMVEAAESSLAAVKSRDLDALFVAGDQLYAPCEACHLQFNPGVAGQ